MINWDSYESRVLALGTTEKERQLSRGKRSLHKLLPSTISCKNVKINNIDRIIMINSGSKPYLKKFHTLPDEMVYPGDLIEWMDAFWLVLNADFDNELYVDGNIQQCNFKLKWQNREGKIFEIPCVKLGANSGTEGNKVIETGNSKATIYLPYNQDTIQLQRGHRFFIDNNKSNPTPFVSELPDNTSDVYNGHGYITLDLTECERVEDDNVEIGICNYRDVITPTPPTISYSKINYKNLNIKSGYSKGSTFTATFVDELGNVIDGVNPLWEINCDFKDELTVVESGLKINISVSNDKLVGRRLNLTLKDKEGICQESSIVLDVVGVF